MRSLLAILLLTISLKSQAQNVLQFDNSIDLHISIVNFQLENHNVDTCYCQNQPYFCKVDGMDWFGKDLGLELPKYELKEIIVIHKGEKIKLNVSQMYNPVFGLTISENHFKVKCINNQIHIYGWFADGAGTYCAKWIVKNGISNRVLLSKSEVDCFE